MKRKRMYIILILLQFIPITSFANVPVVDVTAIANLIKQYNQLQAQFHLLQQTYQNAQRQLNQARKITANGQGHYGFGNLFDNDSDFRNREWSPNTWDESLKGLSGGNSKRYQELLQQYEKDNKTLQNKDYKKGASQEKVILYHKQINNNKAAYVNATFAFNRIKGQLENIHKLTQQIETAKNTKAAIDLSTRMQAEIAYIQVQILKQIAIMNTQFARNTSNIIAEETSNAHFNRLPDQ